MELRDGTWEVGEAGKVTFIIESGALRLMAVDPNAGWSPDVVHETSQRIEVEFRSGTEERVFEARYANGILRIEIEAEDDEAKPGRYTVGDAGEVEVDIEDGQLRLVEVATNPGWAMTVDAECPDEIEVEFRQGALEWEFEAELSKRGRLEIDLEMELEGPYPA